MKKRLLALLLAGAMSVGLAACGNSGDEGSANTPAGGETTPVTDGTGEPSAEGKTVKVGMVCIGDENDQGYTYNFMKAVEEATAQLAERGITVEWSYKKNILDILSRRYAALPVPARSFCHRSWLLNSLSGLYSWWRTLLSAARIASG